jgi:hypothetical protein
MESRLVRQRGDVEAAERHVGAPLSVVIRYPVRPVRVGDVDLQDHEIGPILQVELFDVLVLDPDLEVGIEIGRQRRQPERGKQRVLDRPPVRTRRLRQRRENQLDALERLWARQMRFPMRLLYITKYSVTR